MLRITATRRPLSALLVALSGAACSQHERPETTATRGERSATASIPPVSAEFAIDPRIASSVDRLAREIAIASSPAGYLSLWARGDGELRAARLSPDGASLDPYGFRVASAAATGVVPHLVFTGTEFVAIWVKADAGGPRLAASRIAMDGTIVGSEQDVAPLSSGATIGDPATDGTSVLVPFAGAAVGRGVLFTPGAGPGVALDIVEFSSRNGLNDGSAAFDGTKYVVAYRNSTVVTAEVSTAGVGTGALTSLGVAATSPPRLERSGSTLAVLYENSLSLGFTTLTAPPVTRTLSSSARPPYFDLAGTPNGFWIGYMQSPSGGVRRIGVDLTGAVTTPDAALSTFGFRGIASLGSQALLAAGNRVPFPVSMVGWLLAPQRSLGRITFAPDTQKMLRVAPSDSAFFAVWGEQVDLDGAPTRFRGGRVAFDGTVLDPEGITLANVVDGSPYAFPSVGSDGRDFLVTYVSGAPATRLMAVPVSAEGVAGPAKSIEPEGFSGSNSPVDTLSFDGTNYLAAWDEGGAIVTPAGDVLSRYTFRIGGTPAVAFNGTHHLLAWTQVTNPGAPQSIFGAFAVRVSTAGEVLDAPLSVPLHTATSSAGGMRVVAHGSSFVLAWNEAVQATTPTGLPARSVVGRVVNADLTLGPARVFADATTGEILMNEVAVGGGSDWFAWSRLYAGNDVLVQRVAFDGVPLDPVGFAVANEPDREFDAAITFGGGRALVGYLRGAPPPASQQTGSQARFRFVGESGGSSGGGAAGEGAGGEGGLGGAGAGGGSGDAGQPGGSAGRSGAAGEGGASGEGGVSGDGGMAGSDGGVGGSNGATGGTTSGGAGTSGSGGAGRGGTSGAAGGAGEGGEAGGTAGEAGSGPRPPSDDDNGGCGCRAAPSRRSSHGLAFGALLLLAARRRMRGRPA